MTARSLLSGARREFTLHLIPRLATNPYIDMTAGSLFTLKGKEALARIHLRTFLLAWQIMATVWKLVVHRGLAILVVVNLTTLFRTGVQATFHLFVAWMIKLDVFGILMAFPKHGVIAGKVFLHLLLTF